MQGQKVIIKGAGDLASGIACRLHRSGFLVAMTEVPVPTTVRRTVAFSRAVYEGKAVVEDVMGVLCKDSDEVEQAVGRDQIAVIVDPSCQLRSLWTPWVLVDAIIAKKNLGTSIGDAPVVIGVGPGFTAGKDCHAVVETKRGHNLGRCIWSGGAAPDTGIPGEIGGYAEERLVRAEADGIFYGLVSIGDVVLRAGEIVGYSGEIPIQARVKGVVRGLLQDGVRVHKGMKVGDVDPRFQKENCYSISDKALAVGGGVLEAILHIEKESFR